METTSPVGQTGYLARSYSGSLLRHVLGLPCHGTQYTVKILVCTEISLWHEVRTHQGAAGLLISAARRILLLKKRSNLQQT